jgi:hypothetical protein
MDFGLLFGSRNVWLTSRDHRAVGNFDYSIQTFATNISYTIKILVQPVVLML